MELNLNETWPTWILTDEHPASSYGQPVLVNLESNQAYGSGDLMKFSPKAGFVPCHRFVRKLTEDREFSEDELKFIDRF